MKGDIACCWNKGVTMLGIFYLILCVIVGKEFVGCLLSDAGQKRDQKENRIWILLPAWFGTGTLFITWGTYLISWFFGVYGGKRHPLFYGNLLMAVLGFLLVFWLHRNREPMPPLITLPKRFQKEAVFFGIMGIFITVLMFYVFHVKDGYLYSGFTVFGDYAPHTAMMRSFSWGDNFPTQYPHYGGQDVKYHFMFQFLAGNLEYLGMRIDFAFNLISIFSFLGFLMLLYTIALRIGGRFSIGVLSVLFFLFRSSSSFFRFAWEHIRTGDLWETLTTNTSFIGYTPNENWGLWNLNVYLNQRHLAFGLLIISLGILIFWDWIEAGTQCTDKGLAWFRGLLFTKEAWQSRNLGAAVFVGLIMGLCSFWNGAAVIGGLLILCGMALFSYGKLDYLAAAVTAVVLSLVQTRIFIRSSAFSFSIQWGFLAEDKTLSGVIVYLFWMSGIFFLGLLILQVVLRRRERCLLFGFLMPFFFAFFASLTPDITVNHKYLMISYAYVGILWAWAVCSLWTSGKLWGKAAAGILAVVLTITGVYDFVVIVLDNDKNHRVLVNLESDVTSWLKENTDSQELLLTPEYSMNEVTISGAMLYCGWPYYAWSAGYDTYYRAAKATEMYTTQSAEVLQRLVEEERITLIVYEEGSKFEEKECREETIAAVYPLVYTSQDGRIRIYET